MNQKIRNYIVISAVFALTALTVPVAAPGSQGRDNPIDLDIRVDPGTATAGQDVQVTLRLTPRSGFKINKYPQISMKVAEIDGVVLASSGSVGSKTPPEPEALSNNYFKTVDPLVLTLKLEPGVKAGRYEIPGKLKYFYCVKASGYCAPMQEDISIPVTVK